MAAFNDKYLVRVICATYNHSSYIIDTLNGFAMQQTSFPFVCTIIDDASIDGAQEVIKKYVNDNFDLQDISVAFEEETEKCHTTFAQHKTNRNCFFAVIYLKENHYCHKKSKGSYIKNEWQGAKYIAKCEGDDYWTDSLKLQKQVNFLEEHEEFVLCSHDYIRYFQNNKTFEEHSFYDDCFHGTGKQFLSYSLNEYFDRWWTQPLTCLYRNGDYLRAIPYKKYKHYRDDIFYYYVLKEGKGALLSDVMGVYRIHDGGVWRRKELKTQHEASRDNALAIYVNENDERALLKASREEKLVVINLCEERHLWEALKETVSYKKMVPLSEYRRFRREVYEWFRWKVSRRAKAFFSGKARLFFC